MRFRSSLTVLVLAMLASFGLPPETAGAQRLRRASETVRSGESRSSRGGSDHGGHRRSDSDGSRLGGASSTVRSGRGDRVRSRGRGDYVVWGPRRWHHPTVVVYGEPYVGHGAGSTSSEAHEDAALLRTMVVPQVEGSYVADGIGRGTASVRVLLPAPAEIHGGYSVYVEPLPRGGIEALALGRVGAAWRVLEEDDVHLRLGGSLRHFQDHAGARFGGELLAGLELFPVDPLVLGVEGTAGIVGDAWAFDLRLTVGAMIDIVELYAGWHHLALEALNGDGGVELTGPVAGVRLWI